MHSFNVKLAGLAFAAALATTAATLAATGAELQAQVFQAAGPAA